MCTLFPLPKVFQQMPQRMVCPAWRRFWILLCKSPRNIVHSAEVSRHNWRWQLSRSSKSQNGLFEAPISHWYFDNTAKRDPGVQIAPFKRNVYGHADYHRHRHVESFLHMGYDIWYTKILESLVPKYRHTYHVAFCNYYDVAFNTLFNIGRWVTTSMLIGACL